MLCSYLQNDLVANKSDKFYRAIPRGVLWMPDQWPGIFKGSPSAAVSLGCRCQSWGEKRHRIQSMTSVHPRTELLPFWPASLIAWGFSLGGTLGHHWVVVSFYFTPLKAQTWPREGMCQTSWHIFFVTGELGDSEHQLSPMFPACLLKVQTCEDHTGLSVLVFGSLMEEPVSLVCGVGNCNEQESTDREAGSGSITWCQRTCLLLHLGSLCPRPSTVLVMECPALGKRALGRPESLWHTMYFSVLFLFWERHIFMIVYTPFGFSLLVDITALKGAWILELGSLKLRSWPYHLVVMNTWPFYFNLLEPLFVIVYFFLSVRCTCRLWECQFENIYSYSLNGHWEATQSHFCIVIGSDHLV